MPIVDLVREKPDGTVEIVRTLQRSTGVPDNRSYVSCPYDEQHRMPALRLAGHVVQCRKNFMKEHAGVDLAACMHNAVHVVAPAKLAEHEKECVDRTRWGIPTFLNKDKVNDEKGETGENGLDAEENRQDEPTTSSA